MELVIEVAEWVVWGFTLLLGMTFLMNRHKDGGVTMLSRRYAFLIFAGAAATLFFDISKLHLLWWMPASYLFNLLIFNVIVRSKAKSFEHDLMNAQGDRPIIEYESGSIDGEDRDYNFAMEMLDVYVKVCQHYLMYRIVDHSRLPFKKEHLKAAIKLAMYCQVSNSSKDALRESYYQLSKFQPDSEELEGLQKLTMEAYEKLIEHEGREIDEDERLSGLLAAAENHLDPEDTDVVDSERELLVSELKLWEIELELEDRRQELEEHKQELRDYLSSLGNEHGS